MLHKDIKKLGILAGGGLLPLLVADACKKDGVDYCVIGFPKETDFKFLKGEKELYSFPIYAVSKILKKMREVGVTHVAFAGKVKRADISRLLLDIKGAKLLAMIIKNGIADNSILTTIINFIESEGFPVVPPETIAPDIRLQKGCVTKIQPDVSANEDLKCGLKVLKCIADCDIGQALIIQGGLTLGVEAAEGTDELIKRCGEIKQAGDVAPILIKISKPNQDRRIDLPCLGVHTIKTASKYGIRGIMAEAGSTLILDAEKTIELANKHNIFIVGI